MTHRFRTTAPTAPTAPTERAARALTTAACAGVAALLGYLVLAEERAAGLAAHVRDGIGRAGVTSEVTAVLLNFRGYDTLLEVAVLVAALVAIWSLERGRPAVPVQTDPGVEPVLVALVRGVVPLIVIVAVYLVWRGAHAPGGAFQGGALLGGAVVLVLAAGLHRVSERTRNAARYVAAVGLAVFIAIATTLLFTHGALLAYPPGAAYALILVIEAFLALSIAAILADLFVDVPSVRDSAADAP